MKKLFRHISSQPKAKRDSYAFMVAGTFTGIVALIWAFSLPGKMGTVGDTPEANSAAPFANLIKETGEQLAAVRDGLKSKKSELSPENNAASSTAIVLSPEEISKAQEALETNNTEATSSASSTTPAVPVMIATTTATTSYSASSTP